MNKWKSINIENIRIRKCVAEFEICEHQLYIPNGGKYKIKIYENVDGDFIGYSNLLVKDTVGDFYPSVGVGDTMEKALEDTIQYFLEMTSIKEPSEWVESDFMCADSFDF